MDLDKIFSYMDLLNNNNDELLKYFNRIIDFEKTHFIPAVRFEMALFLRFLCGILQPKKILEIGFGAGVSTLFMDDLLKANDKFTTLERDINRCDRGWSLLKHFEKEHIELIHQNAFDFLLNSTEKYDLIFLDGVKREYINYITPLKNAVTDDGIIICDNILFNGKVVDNELERRYKKGVELLRLFNWKISNDPELETMFLNVGDGLSLSYKLSKKN